MSSVAEFALARGPKRLLAILYLHALFHPAIGRLVDLDHGRLIAAAASARLVLHGYIHQ
jgi:hypothetical protein